MPEEQAMREARSDVVWGPHLEGPLVSALALAIALCSTSGINHVTSGRALRTRLPGLEGP